MKRIKKYKQNKTVIRAAKRVLVGGVDSPVRAFNYVGGDPIPIKRGRGASVYDYDGKRYIDYALSYGASILGHAHPEITAAIKKTSASGVGFGATHGVEVELAEKIRKAIPSLEKIRFVSSGTEAVMGAVRLARGVTGREKIVKFSHSYHGHADYLLAKAGSGLATLGLPASKGVPRDFTRHTLIADYGDENLIGSIFKKYGPCIAAVLVEPVGGNDGVVLPDTSFLRKIRSLTKKSGALLIFDEVITGFRFRFGSAADYFGIRPDIICLGKIIGGGLPVGAYGGSEKVMKYLAPAGPVYQASTFSGNPVVMSAGLATLRVLGSSRKGYKRISRLASYLGKTLEREARFCGIDVTTRHFGGMFSVRFKKKKHFQVFYRLLLEKGVYFAPSEYEANFISFAHADKDIRNTITAIKETFNFIAKKGILNERN